MPPQRKLPIIQSVMIKPTEEAGQLDLDAHLRVLEVVVRHGQATSEKPQEAKCPAKPDLGEVAPCKKWGDEESFTLSSAETKAEEKKTECMSVNEDLGKTLIVQVVERESK